MIAWLSTYARHPLKALVLAALLTACFEPIPPLGVTCGSNDGCPVGLSCYRPFGCLSEPPQVQSVVAGAAHTCALTGLGEVMCWGEGLFGQLGYASTQNIGEDQRPPGAFVALGGRAVQISAGWRHTCAVLEKPDALRCWGEGVGGRLGTGLGTSIGRTNTPESVPAIDFPDTGERVVEVTAAVTHTCARLADGSVYCWGGGAFGQTGLGHTSDTFVPQRVDLGESSAAQISAGGNHTCVVLTNGEARCWGNGVNGQLGLADTAPVGDDELPTDVPPIDIGGPVKQIAAGARHTCARLTDGAIRCWGANRVGQLGYGHTAAIGDDELAKGGGDVVVGASALDIVVGGLWAGNNLAGHTCALLATGDVRCWGFNAYGQLGAENADNFINNGSLEEWAPISVSERIVSTTAGLGHTCILLQSSEVRCWGLGRQGRLGYANCTSVEPSDGRCNLGDQPGENPDQLPNVPLSAP